MTAPMPLPAPVMMATRTIGSPVPLWVDELVGEGLLRVHPDLLLGPDGPFRPGTGEVDRPAAADDRPKVPPVAEDPDVGGRIAVDHEDVGQPAGLDGADPAFQPQGEGAVGGGAGDRLQRAQPGV